MAGIGQEDGEENGLPYGDYLAICSFNRQKQGHLNGGEGDVVYNVVISDGLGSFAEKFNNEPGVLLGGENAADLFPFRGVWADRDEGAQGGGIQGIAGLSSTRTPSSGSGYPVTLNRFKIQAVKR